MHSLSNGAVELPLSHISVRVAWHDTDWTGRVCASPETNHACTVLKNVKENKDPVAEAQIAGRPWTEIDELPPCVAERGPVMRPVNQFTPPYRTTVFRSCWASLSRESEGQPILVRAAGSTTLSTSTWIGP